MVYVSVNPGEAPRRRRVCLRAVCVVQPRKLAPSSIVQPSFNLYYVLKKIKQTPLQMNALFSLLMYCPRTESLVQSEKMFCNIFCDLYFFRNHFLFIFKVNALFKVISNIFHYIFSIELSNGKYFVILLRKDYKRFYRKWLYWK